MEIQLPEQIVDPDLPFFIETLLVGETSEKVILDFEQYRFFVPGAVVSTLALVHKWHREGRKVVFKNHSKNPACGYLQRIDFFKQVGLKLPEPGKRQDEAGRFMPIEEVSSEKGKSDVISSKMAECVSPGGYFDNEPYKLVQYACGEIVTNCKQHAHGVGFVSAQYTKGSDFARIGITDCGRGIRRSFEENNSPHFRSGMTDKEAIFSALEPGVSSTTHLPHMYGSSPNKGVGLSMIRNLMQQSLGYMVLISGNAWFYQDGNKEAIFDTFSDGKRFPGTLCAVTFKRDKVRDYGTMLQDARKHLGLTGSSETDKYFT